MQTTSTHNTEHHHADRGGKILAMVIGLLLLVAAIWALTSLFSQDGTVTGSMPGSSNMAVQDDTNAMEPEASP